MYAKPIFRKPASRPHQISVHRRRFRYGVYTAPPEGKSHAFVKRQHRNPEPDIRRLQRTRAIGGVYVPPPDVGQVFPRRLRGQEREIRLRQRRLRRFVRTPSLQPPGWMEAIRQRTERYPKLMAREIFDVRKVLRERPVFGPTPPVPDVSAPIFLRPLQQRAERAQRQLHQKYVSGPTPPTPDVSSLVSRRPRIQVRERIQRLLRQKYVSGVPAPPTPVSTTIHRRPSIPLRRRWRKAQRVVFVSTKAVVAAGASIGWLVVYIKKRILGHNIRR